MNWQDNNMGTYCYRLCLLMHVTPTDAFYPMSNIDLPAMWAVGLV